MMLVVVLQQTLHHPFIRVDAHGAGMSHAAILLLLISELTTDLFEKNFFVNMNECNHFRNATVLYFVFHQDKVDASFCGRMFHPPLLASNCFLFCLC